MAIVLMEPLRPLMAMPMAMVKWPPQLADVPKVPDLVTSVGLKVNLTSGPSVLLAIRANDEASAQELEKTIDKLLAAAREQMAAQTARGFRSSDPVDQATAQVRAAGDRADVAVGPPGAEGKQPHPDRRLGQEPPGHVGCRAGAGGGGVLRMAVRQQEIHAQMRVLQADELQAEPEPRNRRARKLPPKGSRRTPCVASGPGRSNTLSHEARQIMFRKQRWAMFWLLVVAMILSPATVWCQPPADAPQTPAARPGVDVGYITPDAAAAVVAYPRHILTDPAMEMLPLEVITALGERDFGIDPVQVEQLLAIAEPPQKGPPGAVVVLRLAAPLAEDKLHAPAWDHTEEAQLDGKTYFRAPGRWT